MMECWNTGMMECWNSGRRTCQEGGRIDRRTAIRRPSPELVSRLPPYSNIPIFQHSIEVIGKYFKRHGSHGVLLAAFVIGMSFYCFSVCAAPLPIEEEYTVRRWGVEDGLPEGTVTSVAQMNDGFLWLTTPRHIVRFDGLVFTPFPESSYPKDKPKRFNSMMQDRNGRVWVSGEDGILRYDGVCWTRVQIRQDFTLSTNVVVVVTPDGESRQQVKMEIFWVRPSAKGEIWMASTVGLFRLADDDTFERIECLPRGEVSDGLIAKDRSNAPLFSSIDLDQRGRFWMVSEGKLFCFDGVTSERIPFPSGEGKERLYLVNAREGAVWGSRVDGRRFRLAGGKWDEILPPGMRISALLETEKETWIGAVSGFYRYQMTEAGRNWHILQIEGNDAMHDVRCIVQPDRKYIWVGTGIGLFQLRGRMVQMNKQTYNLALTQVNAMVQDQTGRIWVATNGKGVGVVTNGIFEPVAPLRLFLEMTVFSLVPNASGGIWVGTRGDHLWQLIQKNEARQFRTKSSLSSRVITTLFQRPGEPLWIGTREGLLKMDEFGWLVLAGGPEDTILSMCGDAQTNLWVGTQSNGLWMRSSADVWRHWGAADGLPSETVRQVMCGTDGTVWVTTPRGIGVMSGSDLHRFVSIGKAQGLPEEDIRQILDDGEGNLWVGVCQSIYRVSKTDMLGVAQARRTFVSVQSFGSGDGLESELTGGDCGPLAIKTDKGELWFSTHKGVAVIEPKKLQMEEKRSPVYSAFIHDDRLKDGIVIEGVTVFESGHTQVGFQFTTPCFSAPEQVLFRTRLEGFDTDWSLPGTTRERFFQKLSPGRYRFHVSASSVAGNWREQEKPIDFVILPFFWQTGWFRFLVVMFAMGMTGFASGALMRGRARRKLEEERVRALEREKTLEREKALEQERSRIAKDIHDDIGSSLTRILLHSKAARSEMSGQSTRLSERLEAIETTAVDMTRVMDEIVWAVNPRNDTFDGLVTYLGRYAEEFLKLAGLRCRLDLPLDVPVWPVAAKVRHGLFLAFKEALNNVAKHAAASVVRISVRTQDDGFELSIEDDGKGFKTEQGERAGRSGLANMRSRLAEIGGSCVIGSEPGKGTRIYFRLTERVL
ncbi:MAG: two-component regulator propeller domain-containing protein [bacterium]